MMRYWSKILMSIINGDHVKIQTLLNDLGIKLNDTSGGFVHNIEVMGSSIQNNSNKLREAIQYV